MGTKGERQRCQEGLDTAVTLPRGRVISVLNCRVTNITALHKWCYQSQYEGRTLLYTVQKFYSVLQREQRWWSEEMQTGRKQLLIPPQPFGTSNEAEGVLLEQNNKLLALRHSTFKISLTGEKNSSLKRRKW